jgi:hypothetical protein
MLATEGSGDRSVAFPSDITIWQANMAMDNHHFLKGKKTPQMNGFL